MGDNEQKIPNHSYFTGVKSHDGVFRYYYADQTSKNLVILGTEADATKVLAMIDFATLRDMLNHETEQPTEKSRESIVALHEYIRELPVHLTERQTEPQNGGL